MSEFIVIKDFLSEENNERIMNYVLNKEQEFKTANILYNGSKVQSEDRVALNLYDLGELRALFLKELEGRVDEVYRELGIKPVEVPEFDMQIAAMGNGGRFIKHIDTVIHKDWELQRVVTFVYYFNTVPKKFSGGELKVFPMGFKDGNTEPVNLVPENNMLVGFPSFIAHEVLPVQLEDNRFDNYRFNLLCLICRKSTANT